MNLIDWLRALVTRAPSPSPMPPCINHRNELHRDMEEALARVAQNRKQDPHWIEHERRLLWTMVNDYRTQQNKQPVTLEEIKRVEDQAVGHSDYMHKFTLYCTELAEM